MTQFVNDATTKTSMAWEKTSSWQFENILHHLSIKVKGGSNWLANPMALCVYLTFCSCICVFLVTTLPSEGVHVEEVVVTTATSETHAVVSAVDWPVCLVISCLSIRCNYVCAPVTRISCSDTFVHEVYYCKIVITSYFIKLWQQSTTSNCTKLLHITAVLYSSCTMLSWCGHCF